IECGTGSGPLDVVAQLCHNGSGFKGDYDMAKMKRETPPANTRAGRFLPLPGSAMVRARMDPKLKTEAEAIFDELGRNASDVIRVLYKQVTLRKGLPFEVRIPNATTRKAMQDAREGKVTRYATAEEMYEKLGI